MRISSSQSPFRSPGHGKSGGKVANLNSSKVVTGKELNKNMDKIKFHKEYLDEGPSDTLTLVIKNYMTKDGLSRRIASDE